MTCGNKLCAIGVLKPKMYFEWPDLLYSPVSQAPRLESMENMMKLSQMIIQALDEKSSPLLQLPYITPDMLRHFMTRKVSFFLCNVRSILYLIYNDGCDIIRIILSYNNSNIRLLIYFLKGTKIKIRF